jgi:hypothetical protein
MLSSESCNGFLYKKDQLKIDPNTQGVRKWKLIA